MPPSYYQTRFQPDGLPTLPPGAFAIVTACATTGETQTDSENAAANAALRAELERSERLLGILTGYSPVTGHAEPGFAASLPTGARVSRVDWFQCQKAPVCIFSLCSSFGEYGSRRLGFILDRNRVNVAISRAKCLAVVVADPRIALSPVHSISEITPLNLFCKKLRGAN